MNIWLVTDKPYAISCQLTLQKDASVLFDQQLKSEHLQQIPVGKKAFINLIHLTFDDELPENESINYNLNFSINNRTATLIECLPTLAYSGQPLPNFVLKNQADNILHGSCRKPHFNSGDGLVQVDKQLAQSQTEEVLSKRPSLLMMSGDQIYADDVAGPTLHAIHQVIELLGLHQESFPLHNVEQHHSLDHSDTVTLQNCQQLYAAEQGYYLRHDILPHSYINKGIFGKRFSVKKQAIFTSVNAKNHLISFAEVMAMYLLVWSPQLWRLVDLTAPNNVAPQFLALYNRERTIIENFVQGLEKVQRALAHIPTYMIFDDHDITDDWNLTRGWEEAAYGNAFSKRIIGNALVGYYFCQGWGNAPQKLTELTNQVTEQFSAEGIKDHDALVEQLLAFDNWHYQLATSPKIVVLDTRTQRWRSESNPNKPSGLMDWESLCALQQELINEPCVIMVSAAPIYGVKFIEAVQRVATFFGKPLAVDAENWMAHSGTANVMLNIFRHHKTPPNFIILSGDVHYSFVYEVHHRFIRTRSRIMQITCSGIKNEFPSQLLKCLDFFNRYLYGSYSPLNWFTKRRSMKIKVRKPNKNKAASLYNGSGIGRLTLSNNYQDVRAELLSTNDTKIHFQSKKSQLQED